MTPDQNPVRPLSAAQAAEALNCTRAGIYKLVDAGDLAAIRIGRTLKIPKVCVDALLVGADPHDALAQARARVLASVGAGK